MSILDAVAKFFVGAGRSDIAEEGGEEPALSDRAGPGSVVENRPGPHDAILRQLRQCLNSLLNVDVAGHLRVAPEDALYLERIEIAATDDAAREALDHFFQEFRAAARMDYVRRELGSERQRHIVLDHFTGVWEALPKEGQAQEAVQDAFEKVLSGAPLGLAAPAFEVKAIGRWGEAPADVAPAVQPPAKADSASVPPVFESAPAARHSAPRLNLRLWDAESPGGREVTVEEYPMTIGRKPQAGETKLGVAGTFVSGVHGLLEWDGSAVLVSDGPSRNGFWLNDRRLAAGERCRLQAGDTLRFSSAEDRDPSQYPRLRVEFIAAQLPDGQTPICAGSGFITPVVMAAAPAAAPSSPDEPESVLPPTAPKILATLNVQDIRGTSQLDITHLPFAIGRRHDMDYVVPEGNTGVSREHLIIRELDVLGARVSHPAAAKHGARWGHDDQTLAEDFLWYFDREIVLAADYRHAPAVRLTLRRPA